jgi:hypothetical protein
MMNTSAPEIVAEEPRRGRKPRSEEVTERRRNRSGVSGQRLGVAMSQLDFEKFKYRWVNDTPARLFAMTREDDWDIVQQDGGSVKDDAADLGSAVSQIVGTAPDGSALKAYLCRKPIAYWREDQRMKSAELDKQLSDLRRGRDRAGQANGDYVPNDGISIR